MRWPLRSLGFRSLLAALALSGLPLACFVTCAIGQFIGARGICGPGGHRGLRWSLFAPSAWGRAEREQHYQRQQGFHWSGPGDLRGHPAISLYSRDVAGVSVCIGLHQSASVRPVAGSSVYTRGMAKTDRVLVVDDDPELRSLLAEYLTDVGFAVDLAGDGEQMRRAMHQATPDVIVMDLMLPGADGLALTREVRTSANVPILMLSARGAEIDRIVGLEVGADDYLAKPFSPRELLARLRALLRRAHAPQQETARETLAFGPYRLDVNARRLLRGQQDMGLSNAEFELLEAFVERPNRVLSRDILLDLMKGYERNPFDRTIDIRVGRLRRKIEDDPGNPMFIRTVRGEGYLFNPLGDAS